MTQFERLKKGFPCTSPIFTVQLWYEDGRMHDEWRGDVYKTLETLDKHPGSFVNFQFTKKVSWGIDFDKVVKLSRKALEQYADYLTVYWRNV